MGSTNTLHRNAFNTFFYYVRDKLVENGWLVSGTFSGIATLQPEFPSDEDISRIVTRENALGTEDEIILPAIAVGDNNFSKLPIQIGGGEAETHLQFLVMIFAEDDSQRRDIGNQLYDAFFEVTTNLLDYTGGFPPTIIPSGYGVMEFNKPLLVPIKVPNSPNVADKHRANISLDALVYEST